MFIQRMEQLFIFQTFPFTFSFKPFSFPISYESRQVNFYFASEQFFPETLSILVFRENFKQFLSSQRIQVASANFSRENSSSLDSENFSSYFGAREIVNREKRKRLFEILIMKSLKLNFENCSAFIEMFFNHGKPSTLQNDIYFLSNFFKEQSFGKHANAELF
jgi:hypothetical protein